jgi:hypothetical protein
VRTEEFPTIEPLEEVLAVSMFDSPESALERDAEDFDEEEDIENETLELSKFKKPSQPPVELKPLPPGLRYAFLNSDVESHVIISVFGRGEASTYFWLRSSGSQGHQVCSLHTPNPSRSENNTF